MASKPTFRVSPLSTSSGKLTHQFPWCHLLRLYSVNNRVTKDWRVLEEWHRQGTSKVGLLGDKNLSKCHFVHHKSYMNSTGIQPGPLLTEVLQPFTIVAHTALRDKQKKSNYKNTPILFSNQPDALFRVFIYSFHLSTCFEHQVFIIRRSNCINTSSGMISLCKWLLGMPVRSFFLTGIQFDLLDARNM